VRVTAPTGANHDTNARTGLGELAWLFLRLGATSFGGPAAHTAMMEDEVVRRRAWMTRAHFLDLLGATNLIPGPNSTELAIHIGRDRRGWQGLLVAGSCFVAPAALIVGAFAWAYVRYGTLPEVTGVLYGIKPVIIAVVLQALWGLGRTAIKTAALGALAAAALAASLYGVHELGVLGAAGGLVAIGRGLWRPGPATGWLPLPLFGASSTVAAGAVSLPSLFGVFVKIGAVLFGSGYVLLAFLRADLVERLHWLTEAQLLDAIAVGQVTPGPVFTTATFVGYLLAGASGAAVATVGIFLPAFVFVALSAPFIPRLRASKLAGAVLDGVNVASLALMAAVTIELGRTTVVDLPTIAIAAVVTLLLVRYRVSSMWLVLAGGVFGAIWQLV
jgi:chromate transporter